MHIRHQNTPILFEGNAAIKGNSISSRVELGRRNVSRTIASTLSAGMLLSLALVSPALASSSAVDFGRAETFAVLAATGVTNTGPTYLSGTAGSDIGSHPTVAFTNPAQVFTPGTKYTAGEDAVIGAQQDLGAAYNQLANRTSTASIGGEIGGQTLRSGTYAAHSSIAITGILTLDAQDNPKAVFIFKAPTTLITATSSTVKLINGAQACNVVWQVGSSATLNTGSHFAGAIAAHSSISVSAGVTVRGQLLAVGGAVTLATENTIINNACVEGTDSDSGSDSDSTSGSDSGSDSDSTSGSDSGSDSDSTSGSNSDSTSGSDSDSTSGSDSDSDSGHPSSSSSHQAPPGETGTVDGGVLPNTGSHAWIFALGAGIITVALSVWAFARWRRRNQGHE